MDFLRVTTITITGWNNIVEPLTPMPLAVKFLSDLE
jgi:hypothetical protein